LARSWVKNFVGGPWSKTFAHHCSTTSSITRLVELADPNCAIKTSSSVTWRVSTSLHSHGKHLLPIATDVVPLWVLVIHCQPQATQKKWRSAELIVDNDGMGHDDDEHKYYFYCINLGYINLGYYDR